MDMGRTEGTAAAGRSVGLLLTTAGAGADEAQPRTPTTTTAEEEEEEAPPLPSRTGGAAAAAAMAAKTDFTRMTEVVMAGRTGAAGVGPTEAAAALHRLEGDPTNVAETTWEGRGVSTPCGPKQRVRKKSSSSSRAISTS
jgi:hypothetical protein